MIASPPGDRRDPDYGSKMNSSRTGLAAGSTTAGSHANPGLASSSDDSGTGEAPGAPPGAAQA
jgi:hypothetical protein